MTVSELLKLEKIEFGGIKGKALGELVVQMYLQFQETLSKFTAASSNPLDLGNKVCNLNRCPFGVCACLSAD